MSSYLLEYTFRPAETRAPLAFASASCFVCTVVLSAQNLLLFTKYGSLRGGPSQKIGIHLLGESPRVLLISDVCMGWRHGWASWAVGHSPLAALCNGRSLWADTLCFVFRVAAETQRVNHVF